jgi:Domain of unknown function DUF29
MSLPVSLDDDFYAWILQQASALRSRGDLPVDWDKLAEELDGLGRAEENSLQSCLERLLVHLLKYVYQPQKITPSWENSIENSRIRIELLFKRSPSLKSKVDELFVDAYRLARAEAGAQMRMRKRQWDARLPKNCPWPLEMALDPDFWPSPDGHSNGHN